MYRAAWLMLALALAGLSTGCVTRRVFITSDPPGAAVYRNGQFIGTTPVSEPFVYYGKYRYLLVHDGFEPLDIKQELELPWYEIPGIDFVSENLIPYPFRDIQRLHFALQPEKPVRLDDIKARANILKAEGATIQVAPGNAPPPVRQAPPPLPPPTQVAPPVVPTPSVPPITVPSLPVARSPAGP